MENYSQLSMLEVAVLLLKNNNGKMKMSDLLNATLEAKGIEDPENEFKANLYLDITTSSLFVYMGEEEWDLKANQSLKEYDKDGSAFNSKDMIEEEKTHEISEDDDFEDDNEDDDLDFNSDHDEDDEEDDFEYEDDASFEHDEDGHLLDRYEEDDFDEDTYNDYMDDYEDMYDK